jgi:hypothetical protein
MTITTHPLRLPIMMELKINLGPGLSVLFKLMGVLETSLLNLGLGLTVLFKLMGVLETSLCIKV